MDELDKKRTLMRLLRQWEKAGRPASFWDGDDCWLYHEAPMKFSMNLGGLDTAPWTRTWWSGTFASLAGGVDVKILSEKYWRA